jgi:hypothetical protein
MQTKTTTNGTRKTNGKSNATNDAEAYGPHSPLEALNGQAAAAGDTRPALAAQLSAIMKAPNLTEPERQIVTIAARLINNGDKALVGLTRRSS